MKRLFAIIIFIFPFFANAQHRITTVETDVLVIGGGVGGTAAAIQCARMEVSTALVEPTTMLGGMLTAAGVSCTDGNDQLPSGMWEEFRQALYQHYGRKNLNTGWVSNTNFEPHVGDSIFKAWTAKEKQLQVYFEYQFNKVYKDGNKISGAVFRRKKDNAELRVFAKIVIDATELGDVLAAAGAEYDLGMDDPKASGEKEAKQKNDILQDLTWVAILKDYGAGADKTINKPEGYDPKKYYCCCTDAPCRDKPYNADKIKMLNYGKLPRSPGATHDKYMINWPAHGNDSYFNVVESDIDGRSYEYNLAKQHTLGFIYFMQTELGMKNLGLTDDELDNGLALIPYNREGRRMKGIVRMNIDDIKKPYDHTLYRTGIAVGDYPVDHHHGQYPGEVPKIGFPPIPSYNIPLGCLIPATVEGLIVCEKAISVTNIVNGTTRLQPVVLLTGQAAGVLVAQSIKEKKSVRNVAVRSVQEKLLAAKCYLIPFVDVKPDDPNWEAIQRVGVTGILKGTGKSEGWANKMFFYPDSTMSYDEFHKNFNENYMAISGFSVDSMLTISTAISIAQLYVDSPPSTGVTIRDSEDVYQKQKKLWEKIGLANYQPDTPITRRQLAVLFDKIVNVFNRGIDSNGSFIN